MGSSYRAAAVVAAAAGLLFKSVSTDKATKHRGCSLIA